MAADDPSAELHWVAPWRSREEWNELGKIIKEREEGCDHVPGDKWMTLRLDGVGFSNTVRKMRGTGVLPETTGFSVTMANIMVATMRRITEEFSGVLGYTQSDEIIVFVPPAPKGKGGSQTPHTRNGRVQKIASVAAGRASAIFCLELIKRGADPEVVLALGPPSFDCRVGRHHAWFDANVMLLWRTHDCAINGVADAVYQCKGNPERKRIMGEGTRKKLQWLHARKKLPLAPHQAYGTAVLRTRRIREAINLKTGESVKCERWGYNVLDSPLIKLVHATGVFPEPEWKRETV